MLFQHDIATVRQEGGHIVTEGTAARDQRFTISSDHFVVADGANSRIRCVLRVIEKRFRFVLLQPVCKALASAS